MTLSAELEHRLKRRLERLERIDAAGVRLTTGLAAYNAKLIFRNANARLPAEARMPDDALEEFARLLMEGIDHDTKSAGDSGGD